MNAKLLKHPTLDTAAIAIATDTFISCWSYEKGTYEIDDDVWGLFVTAIDNNIEIISDIERVLLASGLFEKKII